MALRLERFVNAAKWTQYGAKASHDVYFPGARSMRFILSFCEPTTVVFNQDGNTVGKVEYIDGEWVGNAPPWSELYDIRGLLELKLSKRWEYERGHCWQSFLLPDGERVDVFLSLAGASLRYAGCVYLLNEHLPEEVVTWLLS